MKKHLTILILILILLSTWWLYREINSTKITVSFKELRPTQNRLNVYYKGIKIGRAKEIRHSNDYHNTLLRVQLYGRNHKLPTNTKVYLKKQIQGKRHIDYLELVEPEAPTNEYIKQNSWLKGHVAVDIEEFLRNQEGESVETIKTNLVQASENINNTLESIIELISIIQEIANENRNSIKQSITNAEISTKNLSNTTQKINNSITEKELSSILNNLERTSSNTYSITKNISDTSIVGVDEIITKTNSILDDTSVIVKGIQCKMSKSFSGFRLMFGKVIE